MTTESDYVDPYDAYMDSLPRGQQNKAMGHYRPKQPRQTATLRIVKPEKREWVSVKILKVILIAMIWIVGATFVVHSKLLEFLSKASMYIGQSLINYTGKPEGGDEEITKN